MRSLAFLVLLTACGATSSPPPAPPSAAEPAPAARAPDWRNPGGMWMPRQIPGQRSVLESLGLAIDPATLADPTKPPLGAVVSLGGCSASFVSADGLIATNHHCVQGALAYNATPEDNVLENGFLAPTRTEERWAGPTAHAYVVTRYDDVTGEMNEGLAALPDDLARHAALEDREKKLLAGCEQGHPELRCKVEKFFGGGQWYLITQLDFRDVRLVYAPHHAVGNYGGETDNWMWPRHAGDFAFLRAYVGPDGKPAEYADNNVPYRPAYHHSIARQPLKTGDLVLVAGYPGTTKRLSTAEQTEEAASWYFPRSIAQNRDYLAALDEVIRDRPDLKIKAEPTRRGLLNFLKKNGGVLKTLTDGGLVAQRQAEDRALVAWIDGDTERKARYRPALERIRALDADKRKTRDADAAFDDLISKPKLLAQALTIVRVAEERAKPDAERNIEYQERNWTRLQQASRAMKRSYAREIDRAVLRLFLRQALALPAAEQPAFVGRLLGKSRGDKAIEAALDRLYRTKLESPDVRRELLATATLATVRKSTDPFIRLALDALPEVKAREAREDAYVGGMAVALMSQASMSDFLLLGGTGAALGYMLPFLTVFRKARTRVRDMRETLPDTLDLIVVCVEAGMGVDAALNRVGREQNSQGLALGEELVLASQEMQAGAARKDALLRLADRVGIEEFKSLVTFLTQTEEMGGSIARSLRVYAETMRDKRSQAAEEAARNTVIKLIFPLVFFILPAIFILLLGPPGLGLIEMLSDPMNG